MHYRLAVEEIEPGHWVAWALDLPACFSSAQTEAEAVDRAPERIAGYYAWLTDHDPSLPVIEEPPVTEVVETFGSFASSEDPDYVVNAFFEEDRRPLGYWDVEVGLRLLQWTRQDLLSGLTGAAPAQLTEAIAGEVQGSIAGILRHVATAENWYFGHLGLGLDRAELPRDPFAVLGVVRAHTRAHLPSLAGNARIHCRRDELWSARKVLRRMLWHERDHTQHIAGLLARW